MANVKLEGSDNAIFDIYGLSTGSIVAISLAVAIIVGVGSALAAYYLTEADILWTAVAGGGGALVSGLIAGVALRCAFGGTPQASELLTAQHVDHQPKGTKKKDLVPDWLVYLLPQNIPEISFEVDKTVSFETIRPEMTSPVAFINGETKAFVFDIIVENENLDKTYIPTGKPIEKLPSSSQFRMLIVVAKNYKGGWRLLHEEQDISHRTKAYNTWQIFTQTRGKVTYHFDPVNNPKIDLNCQEEPENHKLQWLLSRILTNQTVHIPEYEGGLLQTDKKVGIWKMRLAT